MRLERPFRILFKFTLHYERGLFLWATKELTSEAYSIITRVERERPSTARAP